MRKLQYLFMTLSVLFLAVPAFAQSESGPTVGAGLIAIAAGLGMGIAAGGNINPEGTSMFEPIGGSAPKYTNLGVINPLAAKTTARTIATIHSARFIQTSY